MGKVINTLMEIGNYKGIFRKYFQKHTVNIKIFFKNKRKFDRYENIPRQYGYIIQGQKQITLFDCVLFVVSLHFI